MAKLIGTAGHVDHGKTSLIRALTGIDADRLPEEKARGLTIDIGFAHIELPGVGQVSIVDVPGHERFLANMLVGALGVDVALLCVAADESVMPQTREHLQILTLLPVEKLVVALTRKDLVDADALAVAQLETTELLEQTRFKDSPVVPVSAYTGDGLDRLREVLASQFTEATHGLELPWYLPIDRVFTIRGHGAVVTGTVMQGIVKEGEDVQIEPGGLRARVRNIQGHDVSKEAAEKGQRAALNLSGVKAEDLERGMLAGKPGTVFPTSLIDAKVEWLLTPKHGQRVRVSIGADEVIGKVLMSEAEPEIVQIKLERESGASTGQPVIVRNYSPPQLLGGGRVTAPVATPRKRKEAVVRIDHSDPHRAIVQLLSSSMTGLYTDQLCQAIGRSPQALGDVFEDLLEEGEIIGFAGLWFVPEVYEDCVARFSEALERMHDQDSERLMFPKEAVARASHLGWEGKPLDRILSDILSRGIIRQSGSLIGLTGRAAKLNPAQRALLDRVLSAMDKSGINAPSPGDLAREMGVPVQAVEAVLKIGADAGEAVRLDSALWYSSKTLSGIASKAREEFKDRPFSASEFRDVFGTSRKYAIPLLEHLDATRVTHRQGDFRVFN